MPAPKKKTTTKKQANSADHVKVVTSAGGAGPPGYFKIEILLEGGRSLNEWDNYIEDLLVDRGYDGELGRWVKLSRLSNQTEFDKAFTSG